MAPETENFCWCWWCLGRSSCCKSFQDFISNFQNVDGNVARILMSVLGGLVIASIWPNYITVEDSTATVTSHRVILNVLIPLLLTYGFWVILAAMSGSPAYIFNSVSLGQHETFPKLDLIFHHTDDDDDAARVFQIIQYILLLPMRINISNLYAFCNLHDFSWGVKVSSGIVEKLPSGRVGVPVDFDSAQDIEGDYERARQLLKARVDDRLDGAYWDYESYEMSSKRFRTLVVASWTLSNAALVFIVLMSIDLGGRPRHDQVLSASPPGWQDGIKFVGLVLWSFTVMTGMKFAGAMCYFIRQRLLMPDSGKAKTTTTTNRQKRKNN